MPALTRRQHMMTETPRSSTDSSTQEHIWLVQDEYEKPRKEMDFPAANLSSKMSRHDLRLNTYSKADLHDRYMSSEEEPSPSPDSSDAESTHSEELKHKSSSRVLADEAPIDLSSLESEAQTAIAVAMPIVAYGRPKLIDITNLAPMQKRKRTIKQPVAPSSTLNKQQSMIRNASNISIQPSDNSSPFIANEAAEVVIPLERAAEIARKQVAMAANKRLKEERTHQQPGRLTPVSSAPASWLPEEDEPGQQGRNTADAGLEYRSPSSPNDNYEPYHPASLQPHYTGRKRNNSNPFTIVNNATAGVGKGLTRTWSIAKKGVAHHSSFSSASSSSDSRTVHAGSPYLQQPQQQQRRRLPFPQTTYEPERQLTKKPKMIARGANERQDSFVLPPCPFDVAA